VAIDWKARRLAGMLLMPHFGNCEVSFGCNYCNDGVGGIQGQAQPVDLLPNANACLRRAGVRALLGLFRAPLLLTCVRFDSDAGPMISNDVRSRCALRVIACEKPGGRKHWFLVGRVGREIRDVRYTEFAPLQAPHPYGIAPRAWCE
jgi:hypothetical protein